MFSSREVLVLSTLPVALLWHLLCLKKLGCKGEVPDSAVGSTSLHKYPLLEQTLGVGLITVEPFIDLREPIHSINVYFVTN